MKPLNFKVRGLCRKAPVIIRRSLEFAGLFFLAAFAGELGTMTEGESELVIKHCHPGDVALIHDQMGGMMITTNALLVLKDFSMLPTGTNHLKIQTVCAGITSAPVSVTLILKRPPPAPIVRHRRRAMAPPPQPPIPGGMRMALPNGGNPDASYSDFRKRIEAGTRRSQ